MTGRHDEEMARTHLKYLREAHENRLLDRKFLDKLDEFVDKIWLERNQLRGLAVDMLTSTNYDVQIFGYKLLEFVALDGDLNTFKV